MYAWISLQQLSEVGHLFLQECPDAKYEPTRRKAMTKLQRKKKSKNSRRDCPVLSVLSEFVSLEKIDYKSFLWKARDVLLI